MCNSQLHEFLKALPKCEHHIHIEGALTPQLVFQLAERNGILLPDDDPSWASEAALLDRYSRFTSLDDFLHYYFLSMQTLLTADDFTELAWSYFQRANADGVVHAEISFDPQAHTLRGVPFSEVLAGLTTARLRAEKELGMTTELICCFLRDLKVEDAHAIFDGDEVQTAFSAGLIAGVGLDSSEKAYPPELFAELYQKAQNVGIRRTAHAGEEGPAANVETTVFSMGCERVDHGVKLADDPHLLERVAQRGPLLTVCPLSNLRLGGVANVRELPIMTFLEKGIRFSLNSDDPAYFSGYILDNYCAVQEAFDLNIQQWKEICDNAIQGSWCSSERKTRMSEMLVSIVA